MSAASLEEPAVKPLGQRKQSGPIQIIKKTNFNRQPQAAATEESVPAN